MKIIAGEIGSGKTAKLIEGIADSENPLVISVTQQRADLLKETIKRKLGREVQTISLNGYLSGNSLRGSSIKYEVFIDDLECILDSIVYPNHKLKCVAVTPDEILYNIRDKSSYDKMENTELVKRLEQANKDYIDVAEQLLETNKKHLSLFDRYESTLDRMFKLQNRIVNYNNLPWYKRIFRKVKGEIE